MSIVKSAIKMHSTML